MALAAAVGCSGESVVGGGADSGIDATIDLGVDTGPDVPADMGLDVACPAGQTRCGDRCVDTQTESDHCGACGNACPAGQSCRSGACRVVCPSPQVACSADLPGDAGVRDGSVVREVCVLTDTDRFNCGMCGRACPNGQVCSMGMCAATCAMRPRHLHRHRRLGLLR
ncbi:MAG: hypothetical protein R3A52_05370 [Polyangiales bacterium]